MRLALVGSTGSIGRQVLDIVEASEGRFKVEVLAAGSNVKLLAEQARRLNPLVAIVADESRGADLRAALKGWPGRVECGSEAIADAMELPEFDLMVNATVGYSGFVPTLRAIAAGKEIALANKETLVVGGELITALNPRLYPIDSEHAAIWQCLRGERREDVRRLILTASGGAFRGRRRDDLYGVTAAEALAHPNWDMGDKITIDSATMVNKAFEVIEARWLFGLPGEQISVMIHPQSIVHSMVEMTDGAVMAQLGTPDMHLPISLALNRGERRRNPSRALTLAQMQSLTFSEPDMEAFPSLGLAWEVLERGGNAACVFNAANEVANAAFRHGELPFTAIHDVITESLARTPYIGSIDTETIMATDREARAVAESLTKQTAHTHWKNF